MVMDYQMKLEEWQKRYGATDSVMCYPRYLNDITGDTTLCGDCVYTGYDTWYRYGLIRIHEYFRKHDMMAEAVLWHEFCHHLNYQKNALSGHGKEWKKIRRKQPGLMLMDRFVTFIFPLVRK